jgi:crotonobetainyl-CoA:carnitine CoA-transferase CaiB-like acyl-CoA transferase
MVDIGMLDGAVFWNVYHLLLHQLGQNPQRGTMQLTGRFPCYTVYETRDARWLTIGAYEGHFWATLCRHFGREDFVAIQWDEGRREEMLDFFRSAFRQKTLAEWMDEIGELDICVGPVSSLDEVYEDPQVRHRNMLAHSDTGPLLNSPVKLSDTPAGIRTPPPLFGQHTDDVLASLGFDATAIAGLRDRGVI